MPRPLLAQLAQAFALLTRLPVAQFVRLTDTPGVRRSEVYDIDLADCVWAWPVVGAVVGASGGGAYWLARALAIPPLLAAVWTLVAMVALTGALHEDGLADTADGFGGGATRGSKLAIMRDSRIGTFGALALALSLATRAAAIAAMADRGRVAAALIVAGALGRAAMVGLPMLLPPARADGLGASVSGPSLPQAAVAFAVAVGATLLLLPASRAAFAVLLTAGAIGTDRPARAGSDRRLYRRRARDGRAGGGVCRPDSAGPADRRRLTPGRGVTLR